jgi:hypothetical protein
VRLLADPSRSENYALEKESSFESRGAPAGNLPLVERLAREKKSSKRFQNFPLTFRALDSDWGNEEGDVGVDIFSNFVIMFRVNSDRKYKRVLIIFNYLNNS